jgi:hypothetical protein
MELCRMTGAPQTLRKVDHCYWLTRRIAPTIFRAMDFETVVPQPHFVGCLLRQCEPAAIQPMPWTEAQSLIRNLQQIVTEWQRPGSPPSLPDRVRRRVKRLAAGH